MRAFRPIPAFLLALSAFGCTSNPGASDAGPTSVADLPCSTDAECAEQHFVCDPLRRTCVCTKDAMCAGNPDGAYCNAFTGKCVKDVAGCKSDEECGAGKYCDAALRTCRAKKAWCENCTNDEECGGPNDFCIHHPDFQTSPAFCGVACADGQCPAGQRCAQTEKGKQCIPDVGRCNAISACNPDTGQACTVDTDCTQGSDQVCDRVLGRCVSAHSTCAGGQSCDPVSHQCVAACRLDRECVERFGDPMYSCLNNTCVRAETCHADDECPPGKWCFKRSGQTSTDPGICQPACNADTDCPIGQRCVNNPVTARRSCIDGCVNGDNSGCPLNAICTDGACEYAAPGGARRCQIKQVCNFKENCINNSCVSAPDNCKSCAGGCGAGACATMYANITCGGSTTCPAGIVQQCGTVDGCGGTGYGCGCPISRCLYRCQNDDQCPKGFYCAGPLMIGNQTGMWCAPVDPNLCK